MVTFADGLADIGGALGALQKASDILKNWTSFGEKERSTKLVELNRQILSAQSSAIQANASQLSLIEQIGTLKEEIAKSEAWETNKNKYELKNIGGSAFVYMLKPDSRNGKPAHWICTRCYEDGRAEIIQYINRDNLVKGMSHGYACPRCSSRVNPSSECFEAGSGKPRWLD